MRVSARVVRALKAARDDAHPHEACGILLGGPDGLVTEVVRTHNAASEPRSFEIPEPELSRVEAYAEDRGLQIAALFHSHPSGDSRLSAPDRAALRDSRWPWLIVTRSLRAYAAGDFTTINVAVDEGSGDPAGHHMQDRSR